MSKKAYVVGALHRNDKKQWVLKSIAVTTEPALSLTMYGGVRYCDFYSEEASTTEQAMKSAEGTARMLRKQFFGDEEGSAS